GALAPPYPDLAIAAGRRAAPALARLARQGVRRVQILNAGLARRSADLRVVPEHDRLRGEGVVTTLGAIGRVTVERIRAEAAIWRPRLAGLRGRRLAVLVGGPGPMAGWAEEDGQLLAEDLATLAETGWSLLITLSRRTPQPVAERLARVLDPGRHLLYRGTGENPYPGILGLAEAALVTEDSVNMASEAASAGLPIHIFPVARPTAKCRRFHDALALRGIARPFEGRIESWRYPALAEGDRVAEIVLARLFAGRLPSQTTSQNRP
ncbi:MAG: mitochondrial fission ELM1 family protein, partial [Paracoccaceae bacterium]